jgi:hypothetical protein
VATKKKVLSAEVVMRPRGSVDAAALTAANVAGHMPDPAKVRKAAKWFEEHGFKVEAAGPMSFSITAPAATFRTVFKMRGKSFKRPAGMPDDVLEVTFPPPPDFGPTSY